jgi:hypothetical protein
VPDNVWLRSADPAVKSHRLYDFDVPDCGEGMQPPLVHAGRRWVFTHTYFEPDATGAETRWLMFMDDGPEDRDPLS